MMTTPALEAPASPPTTELGWFLLTTLGLVFAVGGTIAALGLQPESSAYPVFYAALVDGIETLPHVLTGPQLIQFFSHKARPA
ncbi:hypothetical protein [Devosia sp. RR2S18]|uniref:hypothetical protein n=1 Tax=Devosia rhizosphaerae TaxID=3049774 RepID=UPI00253F7418|nr:hypothetical protein [Devosia sp. RR2S18]WIJ26446.1 hypothetical protein QOV41_06705 [Devosia sp. RR2S18]